MPKRAEVNRWLASYDNPMKDTVIAIRDVILGVDERVDECIKWQAPTFTFEGNIASFFPKSKKHASLMFHQGAKIPGKHPLLEGTGATSRVMKLGSVQEVRKARKKIEAVILAWIDLKSGDGKGAAKAGSARKAPAKKAPTKKASAKKAPAKKAPAKKASTKKTPGKKAPAKKAPAKKAPRKKAPAKKAPRKKAPAKKAPAKRTPGRKGRTKKAPRK